MSELWIHRCDQLDALAGCVDLVCMCTLPSVSCLATLVESKQDWSFSQCLCQCITVVDWPPSLVNGSCKATGTAAHTSKCSEAVDGDHPYRLPQQPSYTATLYVCVYVQENGSGSAAERTRTTITNSLKKKLYDLMQDFTALRNNIMNQYRDVVDRRYYTVTGEKASDEQIDQLIETGEAENLFQKAILAQGRGRVWPMNVFF